MALVGIHADWYQPLHHQQNRMIPMTSHSAFPWKTHYPCNSSTHYLFIPVPNLITLRTLTVHELDFPKGRKICSGCNLHWSLFTCTSSALIRTMINPTVTLSFGIQVSFRMTIYVLHGSTVHFLCPILLTSLTQTISQIVCHNKNSLQKQKNNFYLTDKQKEHNYLRPANDVQILSELRGIGMEGSKKEIWQKSEVIRQVRCSLWGQEERSLFLFKLLWIELLSSIGMYLELNLWVHINRQPPYGQCQNYINGRFQIKLHTICLKM